MTIVGVDSEYGPTLAQAQAVYQMGYRVWGCYIYGSDAGHIWTSAELAIIRQVGFQPLPICVPMQTFIENPVAVANGTLAACKTAGILSGGIVLDVENGAPANWQAWATTWEATINAHIGSAGEVYDGTHTWTKVAQWDPNYGTTQPVPNPGHGIQWGQATIAGMSVDLDVFAPDFPLGSWNPPPTPTPPSPTMGAVMDIWYDDTVTDPGHDDQWIIFEGGVRVGMGSPADSATLAARHGAPLPVSAALINSIPLVT